MKFDFYNQFKDYSNVDLLKIIQRPDQYQEEAIKAATDLLSEREVLQTDMETSKSAVAELDQSAQQRIDNVNFYKEKIVGFLDPVIHPSSEVKPDKWLNIFLFVVVLQYVWAIYIAVRKFIKIVNYVIDCEARGFGTSVSGAESYWDCFTKRFSPFIFLELLSLIYVPIIIYQLFKRKRWGWILLFADNLFSLISMISQSYIFFKYQKYHHGSTAVFFGEIIFRSAFVFFLWKKPISDFFRVTDETKKKTTIVTAIITVVFILSMQFFV